MTCHATSLSASGLLSGHGIFSISLKPPLMFGMPPCMQNICQEDQLTITTLASFSALGKCYDIFSVSKQLALFLVHSHYYWTFNTDNSLLSSPGHQSRLQGACSQTHYSLPPKHSAPSFPQTYTDTRCNTEQGNAQKYNNEVKRNTLSFTKHRGKKDTFGHWQNTVENKKVHTTQ